MEDEKWRSQKQRFVDRYTAKCQAAKRTKGKDKPGAREISKPKQTLQKTIKWRDRSTERQKMTEAQRDRDALTAFSKYELHEGVVVFLD